MAKNTKNKKMRKQLLFVCVAMISIISFSQEKTKASIVLELFTSQGCSSCPPADNLVDEIKKKFADQNVFVLSYHVDYWNRLGWRDPFSTATYTDYQRTYATVFDSRSIYTPQLVVNGSEHFTGSNRAKANQALKKYRTSYDEHKIYLHKIIKEEKSVSLHYEIKGEAVEKVTFALIVAERITNISRGENRNRTLKNTNIVANKVVVKENIGTVAIDIPEWIKDSDQLSVIVYTQNQSLKTTGASKSDI